MFIILLIDSLSYKHSTSIKHCFVVFRQVRYNPTKIENEVCKFHIYSIFIYLQTLGYLIYRTNKFTRSHTQFYGLLSSSLFLIQEFNFFFAYCFLYNGSIDGYLMLEYLLLKIQLQHKDKGEVG